MRIIAGACRGRRLETVPGRAVRPTADRAKESLFGILGSRVQGARFLDLFAGCGSVGLEAASRGAAEVVLVECSAEALRVLQGNVRACGLGDRVQVLACTAERAVDRLADRGLRFDVLFADPPYRDRAAYKALQGASGLLAPGGVLVVQHDRGVDPGAVPGLRVTRRRRVGRTGFTFYGEGHAGEGGDLSGHV